MVGAGRVFGEEAAGSAAVGLDAIAVVAGFACFEDGVAAEGVGEEVFGCLGSA
jgi:hypothetical protein